MLMGTASVDTLASGAPRIDAWPEAPFVLRNVEVLQIGCEMDPSARESSLPPALHPTNPPMFTWLMYSVNDGPLGAFTLAQLRIECRSAVRSRGFLVGAVTDSGFAAGFFAASYGYRIVEGRVNMWRDGVGGALSVSLGDHRLLDVEIGPPTPLAPTDAQYVANMNLAETPNGLRLVQVEPVHDARRVERRAVTRLVMNAVPLGSTVVATHPIAASWAVSDITWPVVRFVSKPDELGFTGTEPVG